MIEISNLTTNKIDEKFFQKIGEIVLKKLKQPKDAEISLVFVGDKRMRKLNKKYRGKDRITDVLSFPARGGNFGFVEPKDDRRFLGEIVICLPLAQRRAKKAGYPLKHELTMLFVHGILHLAGYGDETEKGYREMVNKQKQILHSLN